MEGPSAPYGSATANATSTPGASFGGGGGGVVDDGCSGWHPVLCHRPLTVSVFAQKEADAAELVQAQVCGRNGGRKGGRNDFIAKKKKQACMLCLLLRVLFWAGGREGFWYFLVFFSSN